MSFDFDFNIDELADLFNDNDDGGKKIDVMHEETEREIERTRKRLAAEYKQAEKEMKKKAEEYLKNFQKADKENQKLVKQGKMSVDDYNKWRQNSMLRNERYEQMTDVLSQHMVNADTQARDIVHKKSFGIYANNYNYAKYEVEKGLKINTSFTLFDQKTVERLASKNPKLLPDPSEKTKEKIREKKIAKWSKRKINNAITQGVLQGEPIEDIAKRLEDVTRMGWNNAVRNARTAMTGAQNAGRFDSYTDSKRLGIKLKKQWMATLDERTRTSHQNLDGELAEVDKKFSNGLMFPADPEGKPAEVYNCRCTMVAELEDYPSGKFERFDNIEGKPIENCTYKEWAQAKGIFCLTGRKI